MIAAVASSAAYGISYLLHKRKVDEYSSLKVAIQKATQFVEDLQKERVSLHHQVVEQKRQIEEKILDLDARVDKKKAEVGAQLKALDKIESDVAQKQNELALVLRQAEDTAAQKRSELAKALREAENTATEKHNSLVTLTKQCEDALSARKIELAEVERRTDYLVNLEARASEIEANLERDCKKSDALREEIEVLEDNLQDLKSEADLYTRVDDFIGFGTFEIPEYLHEMPERYEAEIRRVRERQRELITNGEAVELAQDIEINGSSKTGSAVISGQATLILRAL